MKKLQGFLVIIALLFAVAAHAKSASEVFDAVSSSIVVIRTYDAKGKSLHLGSGVVLAGELEPPGLDAKISRLETQGSFGVENVIVTNCHVIKDAAKIQVVHKGKEYSGTLLYSDWDHDVCAVSLSGINAPSVAPGSTSSLKVGARVYAVGSPHGLELTLSEGIISSLRPVEDGQYLQISAPISPGSSGGGLFDEEGRLIGLPTFYLSGGQQLNFAVPVEWIWELPTRQKETMKTGQITVVEWLNNAVALEEKKDWAGLVTHSLRRTKAEPKDPLAWHFLGDAYGQSGQTAKAIEAYQRAVRIFPENAIAWFNLGILYFASGQNVKGIGAFQQAVRTNPNDASAWLYLSTAYLQSGQTAEAIEACQQLVRIDPEEAYAWHNLGAAYHKSGQTAKAIECLRKAVLINPEADVNWQDLGRIYLESRQYAKAIDSYKQALRINPKNAVAWADLGSAYGNSRQITKAIESYEQALRIKPKDALGWFNLGLAYKVSGQTGKVMEVHKRLKTLDPAKADEFFNKVVLP